MLSKREANSNHKGRRLDPGCMGSLKNVLLESIRYSKRKRCELESARTPNLSVEVEDAIVERLDNLEVLSQVAAAGKGIDPEDWEMVMLYAADGLSYGEIAKVFNLPVGTVRSRLHRVRKKIQKLTGSNHQVTVRPSYTRS